MLNLFRPIIRVITWIMEYTFTVGGHNLTFGGLAIFQLVAWTVAGLIGYFLFNW